MDGPLPISYLEMNAWLELTGESLGLFEVKLIKDIDNIYVRIANGG